MASHLGCSARFARQSLGYLPILWASTVQMHEISDPQSSKIGKRVGFMHIHFVGVQSVSEMEHDTCLKNPWRLEFEKGVLPDISLCFGDVLHIVWCQIQGDPTPPSLWEEQVSGNHKFWRLPRPPKICGSPSVYPLNQSWLGNVSLQNPNKWNYSYTCSLFNFSRFRISSISSRALSRSWRSLCQYFNFSFKACVSSSSSLLRKKSSSFYVILLLTLQLTVASSKHFKNNFESS